MDEVHFRPADLADADAIGALHVQSWRESYPGILPNQLLHGLSVEARSKMWRTILSDLPALNESDVFVAEGPIGIVGFGACGRQRDSAFRDNGFDAEIGAIYVLKAAQRGGIGKGLMRLMAQAMIGRGRRAASLWVLHQNAPARAFYELLGGALLGERCEELAGASIIEVAYGWSNLTHLAC